jgi:hypothetical protein
MSEPNATPEEKKIRQRSPSYPYLSLPAAIQKADVLYKKDGKAAIPRDAAIRNWGLSLKSSYAQQIAASLRTYGLVEVLNGGALKLTPDALLLLIGAAGDDPRRAAVVRKMALAPPLFSTMWKTYGAELPSDNTLVTALVLQYGFPNEASASDFIGRYKETVQFAKLAESGSISVVETAPNEAVDTLEDEMLDREPAAPTTPYGAGANPPAPKGGSGKIATTPPPSEGEGSLLLQVPFRGTTMTVRIAAGQKLTPAHLARVRAYLELAEGDLEEA